MRIAVIGAGAFGAPTAAKLANAGNKVTLFEKEDKILWGATPKSQNRLHLGLHYPRDLQTAKQSVLGFEEFKKSYGDAVYLDFENYYAIPEMGSKVSPSEFELFAKTANIKIDQISLQEIESEGIKLRNIAALWKCPEGVIDMQIFREILRAQIELAGVQTVFSCEILKIEQENGGWTLTSNHDTFGKFDFVVRCTYSNDQINIKCDNYEKTEVVYQQTLIQVLESNCPNIGITIVDGDFLTILPRGFSGEQLAYGPSISTRRKSQGVSVPLDWQAFTIQEKLDFQVEMHERIGHWILGWEYQFADEILETVRTIEPNVESTDRRTSQISHKAKGLIDVWAGKIDHCVEIAELVLLEIQKSD